MNISQFKELNVSCRISSELDQMDAVYINIFGYTEIRDVLRGLRSHEGYCLSSS